MFEGRYAKRRNLNFTNESDIAKGNSPAGVDGF